MSFTVIILSFVAIVFGCIGSLVPILPGPPLAYAGVLFLHMFSDPSPFSQAFIIWMGIITVVITILDIVFPLLGAKLYGARKLGIIGAMVGLIIGLLWFPPFGMIVGSFLGALLGEVIAGRTHFESLKAGVGTGIASLLMFLLKVGFTLCMGGIVFLQVIKTLG